MQERSLRRRRSFRTTEPLLLRNPNRHKHGGTLSLPPRTSFPGNPPLSRGQNGEHDYRGQDPRSRSGQHPAFAIANTLATLAFLFALACDTAGGSLAGSPACAQPGKVTAWPELLRDDNCFNAPIPERSHVSFGFLGPSLGPARPPASTRAGDFSAAYTPTQDVNSEMAEHVNGAADEGVANGAAGTTSVVPRLPGTSSRHHPARGRSNRLSQIACSNKSKSRG